MRSLITVKLFFISLIPHPPLCGYVEEGDNSSGLEDGFDKTTSRVAKKERKKTSQFPSQSSHVIKSKSNKAAKRHFLLSVQPAPRALLFPFFSTSPLNIRRIVSQFVSVVIAQAIMQHRIAGRGSFSSGPCLRCEKWASSNGTNWLAVMHEFWIHQ